MFQKFAKTTVLAYTNDASKGFGYSKTASIDKIASYYKEQPLGTIDVKAKLEIVADTYKISKNPDDYVFVSVRALTANVPNENHDCFMEDELLRFDQKHGCKVYATFNLKPHHVNHRSSDPTQARGCIIDVHYNTKNAEHFPELLIAVDKTKDKKLAEGIASGELNAFSMGCACEHTLCSICGNKASTPSEFCTHISLYKGKEVEGKIAFEDCRRVAFEEESSVDDPADKQALTQEVILASKGDNKSDMAMETEFLAVNSKLNGLSSAVKTVIEQLKTREASKKEATVKKKSEEDGKFGIFIYVEDSESGPLYAEYADNKTKAISIAKVLEKNKDEEFPDMKTYIEVWEKDKEGLFGNTGEPIYKTASAKTADTNDEVIKSIVAWSKNIAENYNDKTETSIYSSLIDAKNHLGLNMGEIDKRWVSFSPGDHVTPKQISYLLTGYENPKYIKEASAKTAATNEEVISMFLKDSFPKDKLPSWGTSNLKIKKIGDAWGLVNYSTVMLYRDGGEVYSNTTKYSSSTSAIQSKIKSIASDFGIILKEVKEEDMPVRNASKIAGFDAEEIAETFINGNISDARKAIGNSIAKFNAVLSLLEEWGQDTSSFRRQMSRDASADKTAEEEELAEDASIIKPYGAESPEDQNNETEEEEDNQDDLEEYKKKKEDEANKPLSSEELGIATTMANKKIKSNGGTMSVNTLVTKEANPYLALKKKAVDSAAKEYWEKLQPGYGKDMTKEIKKKKLQALLEKKRAEKASDKLWKGVQKGSGNPPALWKTKGKGNPPKEFKNAASDKLWKEVNKGSGNAPAAWKNVTGKGNPPKEFKFAKLYQDIQAFPAGNMLVIAKAMRPIYVISNVSPNAENKTASETKLNPVAVLRAIASKGLKVAMDEYKAKKLQALYPTVRKPSIVDDPIGDGMIRVKPTDSVEKGGDDDLSSVDRSKLKETNLSDDGKNDIKLANKKKADLTKLIDMIKAEQSKGTTDAVILKMVDTYIETKPTASKKSSISETTTSDLVNFSKTKPESTKPLTSGGGSDLAGVKRDTARADDLYSGGKDDLDADELKKNVVTVKADKKIALSVGDTVLTNDGIKGKITKTGPEDLYYVEGSATPYESSDLKVVASKKLAEMTPEAQDFVSKKIEKLIGEGKPQDQAAAIAYSMAREEGFDVPEKSASMRPRIIIDKKAIKAEIESEVKKAAAKEVAEYKTAFRQRFLRSLKLANLRATKNLVDNPLKASMADVLYTPTKEYIGMDMELANQLTEESFAKGSLDYINSIVAEAEKFIEMPEESFLAIEDDTKKLNLVIPVADIESTIPGDFGSDEPMYEMEESPIEAKAARFANANPIFKPSAEMTTKWSHLKGIFND